MFANLNLLRFDGTMAHEVRHGGQIARKQYGFDKTYNPYNYGVMKEVDTYRAQWGWSETGIINIPTKNHPQGEKISEPYQINNRFIESIIYPSGENVYNFNKNGK